MEKKFRVCRRKGDVWIDMYPGFTWSGGEELRVLSVMRREYPDEIIELKDARTRAEKVAGFSVSDFSRRLGMSRRISRSVGRPKERR